MNATQDEFNNWKKVCSEVVVSMSLVVDIEDPPELHNFHAPRYALHIQAKKDERRHKTHVRHWAPNEVRDRLRRVVVRP